MNIAQPNPVEKKIISTDVDGVLVSWQSGLPYFAQKYNLPLEHILKTIVDDKFVSPAELFNCAHDFATKLLLKYNNSDFIRYLAPYADALKVINELKSEYDFVAVTALGTSVDAHLNRQFNLNALFPGAFKEIFVCGHNESKDALLVQVKAKYKNRVVAFVDDLGKHIDSAHTVLGDQAQMFYLPRGERDHLPNAPHELVNDWHDIRKKLNAKSAEKMVGSWREIMEKTKRHNENPIEDWRHWVWPSPATPTNPYPGVWRSPTISPLTPWYQPCTTSKNIF